VRLYRSSTRRKVFFGLTIFGLVAILVAGTAAFLNRPQAAQASRTKNQLNTIYYQYFGPGAGEEQGSDDNEDNPDAAAAAQLAGDVAFPATKVGADQILGAQNAFKNLYNGWGTDDNRSAWKPVGPSTTNVSEFWTYTGDPSVTSGRITALGIGSVCHPGDCRLYLGAAGGGVWRTDDALATPPAWKSVSLGLFTNAIGSLWVDPKNSKHVLVGTGEPNGSGDSEAGVGLFESFDGGNFWLLVPGSLAAAKGRSIAGIAVDPSNSRHIFIGTALARHGSSSSNGGRFTPPNGATLGLYESNNGGLSFKLVFSRPSDSVDPTTATGNDFFRGGVSNVRFDPTTPGRVYLSIFDYGVYRSDGHGGYEQVFASAGGGSVANSAPSRTEFALAPLGSGKLRIYVADAGGGPANVYRVDDAGVAASALTDGTNNPGWTLLSNPTPGTPGFSSYDTCDSIAGSQCSYDMPIASPAGRPDNVWLGGSMQYQELNAFGFPQPSNGRAVVRSENAGVSFTDMTNDQSFNGMHPDQHVIVFDPEYADIAFTGSDGGLVRTSGVFANQANDPNLGCAVRGISGAALTDCQLWLSKVPVQLINMNAGLQTLQFQSLTINPTNAKDIQGGTQDNGTLLNYGSTTTWTETVGGDGGQTGFGATNPNIRFHSYTGAAHDVSFNSGDPLSWDLNSEPLSAKNSHEAASFYAPTIADPKVGGTMFDGLGHVWRTQDNGGDQAFLDFYCNEFSTHFSSRPKPCGDWVPLGGPKGANQPGNLVGSAYGTDKAGSYVVAIRRATSDNSTMWAGTRIGRLFITQNADAADPNAVTFTRIDTPSTPTRFVSGIAVDPTNANHAYVSFSGYDAYAKQAGTATGHVFDVTYDPGTKKATWTDISTNIGDQPITGIAWDSVAQRLYISTDFSVLKRGTDGNWRVAAPGLPLVATYGLTIDSNAGVLYAATHGRGAWRLDLPRGA
jgi:hypothetical protein